MDSSQERPRPRPEPPPLTGGRELVAHLLEIERERLAVAVRIERERNIVFPETTVIIRDIQRLADKLESLDAGQTALREASESAPLSPGDSEELDRLLREVT